MFHATGLLQDHVVRRLPWPPSLPRLRLTGGDGPTLVPRLDGGTRIENRRQEPIHRFASHYGQVLREQYLQCSIDAARPLDPVKKMEALVMLAMISDRQGKQKEKRFRWKTAVQFGRHILGDHRHVLPLRDQIGLGRNLAHALRVAKRPRQAIAQLKSLLELLADHDYALGRREILAELASHYEESGDLEHAEQTVHDALKLYPSDDRTAAMSRADLLGQLSIILDRRGNLKAARAATDEAAQLYRQILNQTAIKRHDSLDSLNAFWRLKDLLRHSHQYRQAVELVSEQPWAWTDDSLLSFRLSNERGALHAAEGSYDEARIYLSRALDYHRHQNPLNLSLLPRTLNNLALVEQATGNLTRADELCRECLDLYKKFSLPPDRDLAETYNLLATGAALQARYAEAVQLYRRGIDICRTLGKEADNHRGNLLLNLAKTYKSQGQYDAAIEQCQEALQIIRTSHSSMTDTSSVPAVYCALATMYVAQEKFDEAREYADKTLKLCDENGLQKGPVISTAQHCLAIVSLVNQEYAQAKELWQSVLTQQQQTKQKALTARTYNYLAATEALQGNLEGAEEYYRQALHVLEDESSTYPVMRFVSLWKLAKIRHLHGDEVESRELLKQAIEIAEATRVDTYGAEQHRADFFAQFAPAFDAMFHLSLRDGNFSEALAYAERGRSRTFLDQLQLAGVDPRNDLKGTPDEKLLRQEAQLKRDINLIRSKAQQVSATDDSNQQSQKLHAELKKTQHDYAELWHQILNASPHYRNLLVQNLDDWSHLQHDVVRPGSMMLYYYLGRNRGYLVLIGGKLKQPEVYMLDIPAGHRIPVVSEAKQPIDGTLRTRGLKRQRADVNSTAGSFETTEKPLPLTRRRAEVLIDSYLQSLMVEGVASVRGVKRKRADENTQRWDSNSTLMADILLPTEARRQIRRSHPDRLIVVPDGAVHKIPLEALVLSTGPQLRYVLDELPPISYVPSAGVLAALLKQPKHQHSGPATLLTIGDPAYPTAERPEAMIASADPLPSAFLGLRGQVDRLPKTAEESRRVAGLFDKNHVTSLQGEQATEENVMAALSGQRYLHFAAHAYVDRQHGNLLGGILLTPPEKNSHSQNYDGVLALNEIYTMQLSQCELAVLSACETNVGPHETLEAGFSLARAFFKAGARRVVASHWTVEDESTAELVGELFQEVADGYNAEQPIDYAQALQTARLRVRNHPRWSHPFFWAPFVLIGPAEDQPFSNPAVPGDVRSLSSK